MATKRLCTTEMKRKAVNLLAEAADLISQFEDPDDEAAQLVYDGTSLDHSAAIIHIAEMVKHNLENAETEEESTRAKRQCCGSRLQKWEQWHVDCPGYRKQTSDAWPDGLKEWHEEVDILVKGGTVPHPAAGMKWMYNNYPDFKTHADTLFYEQDECVKQWNKTRLFWVLNRAACTVLWSARIARTIRTPCHATPLNTSAR
tara:strand:+ start:183 stop:785 length:603 start_codon:yes stop_codon:yes gene_type:complete